MKDRPLKMISDYFGDGKHSTFKCLVEGCGNEWSATPGSIFRGRGVKNVTTRKELKLMKIL